MTSKQHSIDPAILTQPDTSHVSSNEPRMLLPNRLRIHVPHDNRPCGKHTTILTPLLNQQTTC